MSTPRTNIVVFSDDANHFASNLHRAFRDAGVCIALVASPEPLSVEAVARSPWPIIVAGTNQLHLVKRGLAVSVYAKTASTAWGVAPEALSEAWIDLAEPDALSVFRRAE